MTRGQGGGRGGALCLAVMLVKVERWWDSVGTAGCWEAVGRGMEWKRLGAEGVRGRCVGGLGG